MELRKDVQEMGKLNKEPQIMDIFTQVAHRGAGGKSQGFSQKQCALGENEIEIDGSVILELLQKLDEQKFKPNIKITESSTISNMQVQNEESQNFENFQNHDLIHAPFSETVYVETSEEEECTKHAQDGNFHEIEGEVDKNAYSFGLEAAKLVHKPIKRAVHVPIQMVKEEFEIYENSGKSDFMDSFEEFLNNNTKVPEVFKVLEVGLSVDSDKVVKAKVHVPIKLPKEEIEDFSNIQKFEKCDDSMELFEEFLSRSMNIEMSSNGSLSPERTYNLTEALAIVKESNEEIRYCNIARSVDADPQVEASPTPDVTDCSEEIYYCYSFKDTKSEGSQRPCVKLTVKNVRAESEGGQIHSNNDGKLEDTRSNLGFTESDFVAGEIISVDVEDECNHFEQLAPCKIDEVTVDAIEKAINIDDSLARSYATEMPDSEQHEDRRKVYGDLGEFSDDTNIFIEDIPDEVEVLACRSFIAEELDAILEETANGNLENDGHGLLEPSAIEPVKTGNEIINCDDSNELTTFILTDMQESNIVENITLGDEKTTFKRVNTVEIELFQRRSGGVALFAEDIPVKNEVVHFTTSPAKIQGEELNINLDTTELEDVIEDKIEVTDNEIQYVSDQKVHEVIEAKGCQFIVIDETLNISVMEETQKGEYKENEVLDTSNGEETRKRQCEDLEEFGRNTKLIKLDGDTNEETDCNKEQAKIEETNQKTVTETIVIESDSEEPSDETVNLTKENQKRKRDESEEHTPSPKMAKVESTQVQKQNEDSVLREPQIAISQFNPLLARSVLRNPMTSTWQFSSHYPYMLCNLIQQTPEYERVKKIFRKTATRRMAVSRIYRVENPYLLGMYLMKKEKMERNRDRSHQVIERQLFHGTRQENIDGICRYNFDWRRRGQSRGHKFGQGVSFSPKASYARHYNFGDDVMFLARVLVSRMVEGSRDTVVPPEPYDTTRNQTGDVIVKYDDDDFYPQYIIYYYYRQGCGFFFNF